jgi:hypothetical protein
MMFRRSIPVAAIFLGGVAGTAVGWFLCPLFLADAFEADLLAVPLAICGMWLGLFATTVVVALAVRWMGGS